jgi:hypothetical protein
MDLHVFQVMQFHTYSIFFLLLLLHLLLLKHYSPLWTLASNTVLVHSFHPLATACQFLIHIIFRSFPISSVHLFYALPLFLIPSILAVTVCIGLLSFFIRSLCPYHLNLSNLVNFTVPAPCDVSCIPLLFLILQLSSSYMGPYIFLTIYPSNALRAFIPSEVIVRLLLHNFKIFWIHSVVYHQ